MDFSMLVMLCFPFRFSDSFKIKMNMSNKIARNLLDIKHCACVWMVRVHINRFSEQSRWFDNVGTIYVYVLSHVVKVEKQCSLSTAVCLCISINIVFVVVCNCINLNTIFIISTRLSFMVMLEYNFSFYMCLLSFLFVFVHFVRSRFKIIIFSQLVCFNSYLPIFVWIRFI